MQLEDDETSSLWPKSYIEKLPEDAESEQTIDEYVEDNYFRKGLFN